MQRNHKKRLAWGIIVAGGVVGAWSDLRGATDKTQDVEVDAVIQQTIVADSPKNLNFGTIELDPAGDTITIDASSGAATTATKTGGSVITGTVQSGSITVSSPLSMDILVTYPASVTLNGVNSITNELTVQSVTDNSEGSSITPTAHAGNTTTTFNVGGVLNLPVTTVADTYEGTMTVELSFQ